MKKSAFIFGFFILLGCFGLVTAGDYVPGRLIVDIKHEYLPINPALNGEGIIETGLPSIDSLNALYQVYSYEKIYKGKWSAVKGYFLLNLPESIDVIRAVSSFSNDGHILSASPDFEIEFNVTPVDSFYPQQWGLRKIKCPDAWRYTNGSPNIIIEIIDNCIDFGHPDLVHNIWQNTGGYPYGEDADGDGHTIEWDPVENKWILDPGDINYDDDDNNDYPDDLVGWDFQYDDPNPECDPPGAGIMRDHGDCTSGTAAAVTNNYITPEEATHVCWYRTGTVAGTAWFCRIMPTRSRYFMSDSPASIAYGVDNGAKIINMSWGYEADFPTMHNAIDSAWAAGLLLVASAGNNASEAPFYPAAYENVIAVAGTDSNDVKAENSNWGMWVDICAPYWSVAPDRDSAPNFEYYCYTNFSGTSASAPYVAGVAALVWTCNQNATNAEVRDAILNTADYIYGIPENWPYYPKLGSGRVNALEAVKVFRPVPPASGDCNADGIVNIGDLVYLVGYLYRGGNPPDPLCVGDVNDDGIIDVGDVVYLESYLYRGGPPPLDGCN